MLVQFVTASTIEVQIQTLARCEESLIYHFSSFLYKTKSILLHILIYNIILLLRDDVGMFFLPTLTQLLPDFCRRNEPRTPTLYSALFVDIYSN